jgi:hypothetical protein
VDLLARCLVLSFLCLAGCAGARPPASPADNLDVCGAAAPGSTCRLPVEDGPEPVASVCTKQRDGSLVCDSPDLPPGGPRVSTNAAEDYGPR